MKIIIDAYVKHANSNTKGEEGELENFQVKYTALQYMTPLLLLYRHISLILRHISRLEVQA